MKTSTRIAVTVLFLFSASAVFGTPDASAYKLTIDPAAKNIAVEAEMTLEDDRLFIAGTGANQFTKRWAEFIRKLRVFRIDGTVVEVTDSGDGTWKLAAEKGDRVRLSYNVALDHESHQWSAGIDGASYIREWGIFSVGRAFAVMNGESRSAIRIDFELPREWQVSGSWKKKGDTSFVAENNRDLSESMFFAGTHKEFSIVRSGFELQFAVGGPGVIEKEAQLSSLAEKVLDYYIDLMGGIPKPPPGTRFDKVLAIISPGKSTDGEVIGNHISMILDTSGDPMGEMFSRFIFAHEFFHLWNGKSIIPASVTEEWFKEGVSNYYTIKALRSAGAVNEQAVFGVMNGLFFQRYANDEAYGSRSISEVSAGDDKHKHWGMIYGGGLFAGICRDVAIRKATGNRKSLDDVMVGLFRDFGGSPDQYSRKELLSRIGSDTAGNADFFGKYVYGPAPVPIDSCLRDAGLNAEIKDGQLLVSRKENESAEEKNMIDGILGGGS